MDKMPTWKGAIGMEHDLAAGPTQLDIKEVKEAGMTEQGPAQGHVDKPNDGFPLTGFEPICEQESHTSIVDRQGGLTDPLRLSLRSTSQINSQPVGQALWKNRITGCRVDAAIDRRHHLRTIDSKRNNRPVAHPGSAEGIDRLPRM